jgi:hypothetical protein
MSIPNEYICPKDCPGRSSTCHSKCERYAKFRAEIDKRNQAIRADETSAEKGYLKKYPKKLHYY